MTERKAQIERKSKETEIKAELNIDGKGKGEIKIKTHIGLLDHMLELFSFHGHFDLNLEVQKADLEIDIHHTNEDIGIVLGKIFKKALGEKEGIRRFGSDFAPMEDTLGHTVIDISGRGHLSFQAEESWMRIAKEEDGYTFNDFEHFLDSFAKNFGANIIITIKSPTNTDLHTIMEAVFKSFGLALHQATRINPLWQGIIPSTKGIID